MTNSNITVDEVMERIKQAMKAEKNKLTEQMNTEDESDHNQHSSSISKLAAMDIEIKNNNLKCNIATEWLITSHRKITGSIIVFGKKLVRKFLRWYINPLTDHQREFNGSVTRSINSIGDLLHDYNGLITSLSCSYDQVISRANGIEKTFSQLNGKVNEIENAFSQLNGKVNGIENAFSQLNGKVDGIENAFSQLNSRVDGIENVFFQLNNKVDGIEGMIKSELAVANDRLRRIERKINSSLNIDISTPTINKLVDIDKAESLDIDYFLFEQRFRGSREDIKERLRVYLGFFKGKNNILDIGCGRGEFIELLMENSINANGIDINEDMVGYCQDRGLPAEKADALSYLDSLEDGSLDGIIAVQVIEHLRPQEMIRLIEISYRKLKLTGVLIMETINPRNLRAVSEWFYMDLSHVRPVHPQTLEFISEAAGFAHVENIFLHPTLDGLIPELEDIDNCFGKTNTAKINRVINTINDVIWGPQDYAIIAYK